MDNKLVDYKNTLKEYTRIITELNNKKLVEETNLKHVKEQHQQIVDEVKKLGFDPNNLESIINEQTAELQKLIEKLNILVPKNGEIPENVKEILENVRTSSKKSIEKTKIDEEDDDWGDFLD